MENKPKKSKAIIITIIIILLLLLVGFFVLKNNNFFGPKTFTSLPASQNQPGFFAKLFSPLLPSSNPTGLNTGENTNVGNAQAGEDIKQGDIVYKTGTGANNLPIVKTTGLQNQNKYGTALEDIKKGSTGNILIDKSFWDSIKDWIGNMFTNNPSNQCSNGATNPPACTTLNGKCLNNAIDPPTCTTVGDNTNIFPTVEVTASPTTIEKGGTSTISWTSTDAVSCNAGAGNGTGKTGSFSTGTLNASKSYTVTCTGASGTGSGNVSVLVTTPVDSKCLNGATDYPSCDSILKKCFNGATNYPACDQNIKICMNGATNPPLCDNALKICLNGSTNYPACDNILNRCINGATNYPACDQDIKICMNGATNPPLCDNTIDFNFPMVEVTADPTSVAKEGSSTINWTSTNASSCEETTGQGGKGLTGTFGTGPLDISKAYTVTCTGASGKGSGTAFVFVNPEIILPPDGEKPQCDNGLDDDGDGLPDVQDPQCHSDGVALDKNGGTPGWGETYNAVTWVKTNLESGSLPPICPSPKKTDSSTGKCISIEECTALNKIVSGDECIDNPSVCPSPKITDSDTGDCINASDCKSPKVVNGNVCENAVTPQNICLDIEQNPITFTPEEKARLAVLLRKFYLISSTLRTSDDISTIYSDIDQQKIFMGQTDDLTKQCYLETNDSVGYADFCTRNPSLCNKATDKPNTLYADNYYSQGQNLTLRRGNPWYQKTTGGSFPYSSNEFGYMDYNWLEGNYVDNGNGDITPYLKPGQALKDASVSTDGPGCKYVSGYYYGTLTGEIPPTGYIGDSCNEFNLKMNNNHRCYWNNTKIFGDPNGPPSQTLLESGCKWVDGVDMILTEMILNIW